MVSSISSRSNSFSLIIVGRLANRSLDTASLDSVSREFLNQYEDTFILALLVQVLVVVPLPQHSLAESGTGVESQQSQTDVHCPVQEQTYEDLVVPRIQGEPAFYQTRGT